MPGPHKTETVPTYCYQCVAGPDLLKVRVEDGVAVGVEPNLEAAEIHPGAGKICVKAYGLIQKAYNPHRVLTPMRRTNPKKGRDQDPGFVAISWDEALDEIAGRLGEIRETGLLDASGFPRVAASFGGGGTPQSYMGTFPAFLAAWGPIDFGLGSGQGVKCYHSEHLYGELWHRAFIVTPDTPMTKYLVSFGNNIEASGGVCGVWRHAEARVNGLKRVQVEPALSITAACSDKWVPIRPKTDAAFMFAMLHVLLHEVPRDKLDIEFLKDSTSTGYLVGPNGYYLRNVKSRKPLVGDLKSGKAQPFDKPGIDIALEGEWVADGIEIGPDEQTWTHKKCKVQSAFSHLVDHVNDYTPEWAAEICDVDAATIRQVALDFVGHACIGETVEIEGETLPFRPVAITLGKTVNNGWGGFECCWARTVLCTLVGSLEVPGGLLGTAVRLNKPIDDRIESVVPGPDGLMAYPFNPTDSKNWRAKPKIRNAYDTLVPLAADTPWSQALGPTHLGWLFQDDPPENLPRPTLPDVWFLYRSNPAISSWDAPGVADKMAKFPYLVAFAYTMDESNHMADILLPDCVDIESTQLIRIGGTKFIEQFWRYQGYALRPAIVEAKGEARDFTDIATALAERTGLLATYNARINSGAAGVKLSGDGYDFSLDVDQSHGVTEIWDAICRAASSDLTDGAASDGLDWYREHGVRVAPFPQTKWYLYPKMKALGLRFELPYQERLYRIGGELANRLHEHGINWWDEQLKEYQALPKWKDFPGLWLEDEDKAVPEAKDRFWLLTSRSMQYAWGGNAAIQIANETGRNIAGHDGVIINRGRAESLGINDGDRIEVRSGLRATSGRAVLREGIRPDTLLMIAQFDHWKTPFAKDFDVPSMNTVTPITLKHTDATGSGSDIVRVGVRKIGAAS